MKNLTFDEKNCTIIPDGYKWCSACGALTPYRKHSDFINSRYCEVCDNFSPGGEFECPRCGCEEDEDYCEPSIVVKHLSGCHREREFDEKGYYRLYSHAENVLREFTFDFMRPAPDRNFYCLPKDRIWYNENRRLKRLLKDHDEKTQCGCPKFIIYSSINQKVIASGISSSIDCVTDYWWRYTVRCPICGYVYENEQNSC